VGFLFCLHIFCTFFLLGFLLTSPRGGKKKKKKNSILLLYIYYGLYFWVFILFACFLLGFVLAWPSHKKIHIVIYLHIHTHTHTSSHKFQLCEILMLGVLFLGQSEPIVTILYLFSLEACYGSGLDEPQLSWYQIFHLVIL